MTGIESSNYCSCVSNERRTEWRCGLDDAVPNTEDTDPTMLRVFQVWHAFCESVSSGIKILLSLLVRVLCSLGACAILGPPPEARPSHNPSLVPSS